MLIKLYGLVAYFCCIKILTSRPTLLMASAMKRFISGLAMFAGLFCLSQTLSGKSMPIQWGTAATISSDSDVAIDGALIYAYNIGPSGTTSPTVNGVTFSAFEFPPNGSDGPVTVGSLKIDQFPGSLYSASDFGSGVPPFSELSPSYKTLLTTGGYSLGTDPVLGNSLYVTLNDLTPNQEYLVEIWASNASGKTGIAQTRAVGSNSVTLDSTSNSLGQYAIGTFTYEYSSGTFVLDGVDRTNYPVINAIQLRAIPEPATWLLFGLGLVVPLVMRRRKRP